jgi:PIN domain nuclease of toxin-antitoxin system
VILLDTHVWVRWLDPQQKPLAPNLVDVIETAGQVAVSAITCWEIAWLTRRGRLQLKLDLHDWLDNALQGSDVTCIPIDRNIAMIAANLPEHHRDPADRLIIATTIQLNAQLLSLDSSFPAYSELAGKLIQV